MAPGIRKLALVVHLVFSVGWIGAVVVYVVLGISAVTSKDAQTVRAAWIALELTGWSAIVPLALGSLLTGVVMALGTPWGLFRHYWVLITLVLTLFSTIVLLLHMPTVSALAHVAREADGAVLGGLGGDLFHPGVGLLVLLVITVLNVYKPQGLTPYGWRKQQERGVTDFRKLLDAVAVRAGWKPGEIRSKMFRHTYCAARLQTVDQGAPVSAYTVAREMGHGGEAMVRRVYGHLGQVRHRAEAMEYRVEQHAAKLGARLEALRGTGLGTTIGTTA